jgi:hypothetical protein
MSGLALAAAMLAVAAGFKFAQYAGIASPDDATRSMQVVTGLMLAFYANFIPKNLPSAFKSIQAASRIQTALRMGGWAFAIAGLAYATIWALAPLAAAADLSIPVVASAMLVAFGFGIRACRAPSQTGADRIA